MKNIRRLILIILLITIGFSFGYAEEKNKRFSGYVTRTYTLANVSPRQVHHTLERYIRDASYDRNGRMLTVIIQENQIDTFEKLLKKLDIEKKKILFRIFTVIASHEGKAGPIDNPDLKKVLKELQKVLSFKSFRMDGVSALTVKDGQRSSNLSLASQSQLKFSLGDIRIKGEKKGNRSIEFEFRIRQNTGQYSKEKGYIYDTLIQSESSVKENGYLVAGVSKIGKNGDSLVLIINAEIQ
jgi:uncharacterized protein YxeA